MGKEFPLARKEEEGQSVLLDTTSSGEHITTAYNGDERKEESVSTRGGKRGKAKNTKTKSKSSCEAKRADNSPSEKKRRGRDYKDWESDRGDEGEDYEVGRSSQELGITFPGSYCDELETVPHYWIKTETVEKGALFKCKFCYNYLWLPQIWGDVERLGNLISRYGKDEGYCRLLNRHRPAKIIMAKMQELRRLEVEITNKREFARLADKILSEKEYDRK